MGLATRDGPRSTSSNAHSKKQALSSSRRMVADPAFGFGSRQNKNADHPHSKHVRTLRHRHRVHRRERPRSRCAPSKVSEAETVRSGRGAFCETNPTSLKETGDLTPS